MFVFLKAIQLVNNTKLLFGPELRSSNEPRLNNIVVIFCSDIAFMNCAVL